MGHYDSFDPTPYRTHMQALARVHPGERILEVGCSNGALTEHLKGRGCSVVGIEVRPEAAERARAFCEEVVVGDVERMTFPWPARSFDVILLLDVLEHLVDPGAAARRLLPLLRSDGRVLVALPNVAHWSVRFRLLRGRFDYEDSGILDRTHLHLFTIRSARALIAASGLVVLEEDIVPDVPLLRFKRRLAKGNYKVARILPGLLSTEVFFVARPSGTPSSP